jgi:hypothetical protein
MLTRQFAIASNFGLGTICASPRDSVKYGPSTARLVGGSIMSPNVPCQAVTVVTC